MTQIIYEKHRDTQIDPILMNSIREELLTFFLDNKALLDAELDAEETYDFDGNQFKVLKPDCKPIRSLEVNHLLIKNDVVVGRILLRVTNNFHKHGALMHMDVLERTYELRFKTFSGADFTVEGTSIGIVQVDKGPVNYSTTSLTSFHEALLKRHWDEFKTQCSFTAAEIKEPSRKQVWTEQRTVYQGPA